MVTEKEVVVFELVSNYYFLNKINFQLRAVFSQ